MDFKLVLLAGAGGGLGTIARFSLTYLIQSRQVSPFPVATLLINVTGSLLLGFLVQYATDSAAVNAETRVFLTTGFCGGYTTFSTFSYESTKLFLDGDYRRAMWYTVLSVALSLAGTLGGFSLARAALAARRGIG
jgi:CrcB protein